ncbi:MAG TPA: multicopper oxidase domain-containing protein [Tahibacter sp.]|nr:multicopper oxidase domain-containing protein [Tahibacter sp.]
MKRPMFAATPRQARTRLHVALSALVATLAGGACAAQDDARIDAPPVLATIDRTPVKKLATEAVAGAPTPASTYGLPELSPHEAPLTLDIQLTTSKIWNPATGVYDTVELRSYKSPKTDPAIPFVAPTIQTQPGETVRITLNNNLEPEPNCTPPNINTPHCFNSTNLHSHGLWVSPTGNSDNVLITLRPTVSFQYEYNIPYDHPSGTFWYHPHLHGSTALQVASGMAGTLIVRGSRLPEKNKTGDIDTLLVGKAFGERPVLFQQVQYACRDKVTNQIKVKKNDKGEVIAWICDPGDVGKITSYDQFGSSSWKQSGRYTSVNGRVLPTFEVADTGTIERWRAVHAGVRNTISLQFKRLKSGAPKFDRLAAADQAEWAKSNCTGNALTQFEIASDGLTHGQVIAKTQNTLQPGYRSDVLVVFPEPGEYCVIDAEAPAESTVNVQAESRQVLGKVVVKGGTKIADPKAYLTQRLVEAAGATQRPDMRDAIKTDLVNGLKLTNFVPHKTIADGELTKPGTIAQKVEFDIGGTPTEFRVNGFPYNPKEARELVLGRVEEWELSSKVANHPFHIHVNPFEVVKILNICDQDVSDGKNPDYTNYKTVDDCKKPGENPDPQYSTLKNTWRDTLFVKQGYKLYVRSRYERYIGEYVLHCHILDHEDNGMMQNIRMVLPDGKGGGVMGHH